MRPSVRDYAIALIFLAGLSGLPVSVVVTVGREVDPATLGRQPANVRVEQYVPQSLLLSRCDLVVSHAGSGSVVGALAHGLPMLLLPIGADQPLNAARCEALGVARVLDSFHATSADVANAAAEVLAGESYRRSAERVQAEIEGLPGPEHALLLLEQIRPQHSPVPE